MELLNRNAYPLCSCKRAQSWPPLPSPVGSVSSLLSPAPSPPRSPLFGFEWYSRASVCLLHQRTDPRPPYPRCLAKPSSGLRYCPCPSTGLTAHDIGAATDEAPRAKKEVDYGAVTGAMEWSGDGSDRCGLQHSGNVVEGLMVRYDRAALDKAGAE